MSDSISQTRPSPEDLKQFLSNFTERAREATERGLAEQVLAEALDDAGDAADHVSVDQLLRLFFRATPVLEPDFVFERLMVPGGEVQHLIVNEGFNEDEADSLARYAAERLGDEERRDAAVRTLAELAVFDLLVTNDETVPAMIAFVGDPATDEAGRLEVLRVLCSTVNLPEAQLAEIAPAAAGTDVEHFLVQHPNVSVAVWHAVGDAAGGLTAASAEALSRVEEARADEKVKGWIDAHRARPNVLAAECMEAKGDEFGRLFAQLVERSAKHAADVMDKADPSEQLPHIGRSELVKLVKNEDREVRRRASSAVATLLIGRQHKR